MKCIGNIYELVDFLKKSQVDDFVSIAEILDIPAADLMQYAYWKDSGYARNCIERTDDFELLLLCWNPGDVTPVHCHGQQRCWVYQVSGRLEEVIYQENAGGQLVPVQNRQLNSGAASYMEDSMGYHSLRNNSDAKAMSLHLYAKPIENCTYFDEKQEAFVAKDLNYHSYKGQLVPLEKRPNRDQRLIRLTPYAII